MSLANTLFEIDGAILVVSSAGAIPPAVRHQVRLARFFGVRTIIPFLNTTGLNSDRIQQRKCAAAIAGLLRMYDFRVFDILPTGTCTLQNDSCNGAIRLLADMMDRYLRSYYDRILSHR
jgi:translation elongation factor EF-Tu-like GTPase